MDSLREALDNVYKNMDIVGAVLKTHESRLNRLGLKDLEEMSVSERIRVAEFILDVIRDT